MEERKCCWRLSQNDDHENRINKGIRAGEKCKIIGIAMVEGAGLDVDKEKGVKRRGKKGL